MSLLSWVGDRFKDAVGAVGQAEQWLDQRISDAENWFAHVFDGYPEAQAMSIQEIVRQIQSGYGSRDLHEGAQSTRDQSNSQMAISDVAHDLVQRLEAAWSGQGADAARENIRPLAVSADDASRTLSSNRQHIQTQADMFDQIRNSLLPMADPAPEKNWYDNFVPWTTDAEKAVEQYNRQLEQNRQIYDQYHQSSTTVQQGIQVDYGNLPDAQDALVSTFQLDGDSRQDQDGGAQDYRDRGSTHGVADRYQAPVGADNYSLPAASVHPTSGTTGQPGYSMPPTSGTTGQPGYSMPSTGGDSDVTSTAGYVPTRNTAAHQPSGSGPSTFGPASGGGTDPSSGLPAAGFAPIGGGTGGGGHGAGGGASGGAGAAGALQAGPRVGAGESGGYASRPGSAGAAGAAGRSGMSGMAGMGGARGAGQGGDDEEHETKYLVDEDGDEIFGTDERTAPPVIGL
ncbi:hypothetical protein [Amycolatopsis taiwanensis]|uniref:hypothetical protein n=1 Tax=Amycolatopsis taiwanensis TaxID=342230 RepID=UPI000488D463|nr:hypothetical protein [Amycolatopsis taiwanensis]